MTHLVGSNAQFEEHSLRGERQRGNQTCRRHSGNFSVIVQSQWLSGTPFAMAEVGNQKSAAVSEKDVMDVLLLSMQLLRTWETVGAHSMEPS